MYTRSIVLGVLFLIANFLTNCSAHFVWLASDDGKAIVFFGETAAERDYHLPESLSQTQVKHRTLDQQRDLPLELVEGDKFVGLVSQDVVPESGIIETTSQYGVYRGSLLTFYAQHYLVADPAEWQELGRSKTQRLQMVPEWNEGEFSIQLFWNHEPAANASVSLVDVADDFPNAKQTTDEQGKVVFSRLPRGIVGFLASVSEEDRKGDVAGEPFLNAIHFASLTIRQNGGESAELDKVSAPEGQKSASRKATTVAWSLPHAVASFGAAVSNDHLYVYGGHIGEAHAHSRDNLVNCFARISLTPDSDWEDLAFETPVQGLALVANRDQLYRVGGMTARNASGQDDDLHSTTDFCRFDPDSKTWKALTPLPEPRSSHDAVVMDDKLYVMGGWSLSGSDEGEWIGHGLVTDLAADQQVWEKIEQPFERRALAVGHLDGKLIVVGGIDSNGEISREVNVYDPESSEWSEGVSYPGEGLTGFGVSAWNLDGCLYVSGFDGVVNCLRDPRGKWEAVGQLAEPRFFHRMLPGPDGGLLLMGGASMQGHLDEVEFFRVP
ncbi:MAG: hypothetical protein GY768_14210 [Planctomycetaceae bacterium]|nr:hypothetical protein [Planctomycetaceae bacterium]